MSCWRSILKALRNLFAKESGYSGLFKKVLKDSVALKNEVESIKNKTLRKAKKN